jgi:hypothetical protein
MKQASPFDEQWTRQSGKSRIVGMARDPWTIFTYWEVDEPRKDMIARHYRTSWDELPLYLCLYDVTDCWFHGYNAPLVKQFRVGSDTDNWYIHDVSPNRKYVLDLATTSMQDRLFSILRSNVITLPPAKEAPCQPRVQFLPMGSRRSGSTLHPYEHPYELEFDGYHIHEPKGGSVCLKGI